MGSYAPAVIPRAPCPRQQDAEARSPRERELDEPSECMCPGAAAPPPTAPAWLRTRHDLTQSSRFPKA